MASFGVEQRAWFVVYNVSRQKGFTTFPRVCVPRLLGLINRKEADWCSISRTRQWSGHRCSARVNLALKACITSLSHLTPLKTIRGWHIALTRRRLNLKCNPWLAEWHGPDPDSQILRGTSRRAPVFHEVRPESSSSAQVRQLRHVRAARRAGE